MNQVMDKFNINNSLPHREPYEYGKVVVLLGGNNAEREISLQTGEAVYEALVRKGISASLFDTKEQDVMNLKKGSFDRAFIALHGRGGEDGTIQGALELLDLPYTGSGVTGSAIAMDKSRSKWLWKSQGINTPPFIELVNENDLSLANEEISYPMMVKPVHEGSSVGVVKVINKNGLKKAWDMAKKYDHRVMAESWVDGDEYTVSIIQSFTLPTIKIRTPRQFYDYEAKYIEETTEYICPCGLSDDDEKSISELALAAFNITGATGWGRVDLFIDSKNIPWVIEVNTIPGLTSHSLVPMSAKQAGIEFDDLIVLILESSMKDSVLLNEAIA